MLIQILQRAASKGGLFVVGSIFFFSFNHKINPEGEETLACVFKLPIEV